MSKQFSYATTSERGKTYELIAIRELARRGYGAKHLAAEDCHGVDVEIDGGVPTDVKGSIPHRID